MKYVLTLLFLVSKPKGEKKRPNQSRKDNFHWESKTLATSPYSPPLAH